MSIGYTSTINEQSLRKDHPLIECIGTLDELNAFLGDAKAALQKAGDRRADMINGIQQELSLFMAFLAGSPLSPCLNASRIEGIIDELQAQAPPQSSFEIPGSSPVSAKLHIARTVCRRAERRLLSLDEEPRAALASYINRLSDLLFLLATA